MKNISKLFFTILAFIAFSTTTFAQNVPTEGSFGLRAAAGAQGGIELPYQLNENISIAPTISFTGLENNFTSFGFGLRPRYYTSNESSMSTYFTGILGVNNTSLNAGGSRTFFRLGVGYGAEYFVSDTFSLSADIGLSSNVGGDVTNSISTAARVSAAFYFN